ncbi:MAG: DNA polymerase III subunit delta, partial [Chitinophagaceae bacterium]
MSADKIISEWKKNIFKPFYWLEGEEYLYIDAVMNYAEHNILSEADNAFNLSVFYGKDANWVEVVNACSRYPMFAQRQVILLKEAQQMKEIDRLENYIANPLVSPVFVVSSKGKTIDGRSKLAKLLKQNGEVLSTKKLYDNQLPGWTNDFIQSNGYTITPRALTLLVDHIGNDLSRIVNEFEKVSMNLHERKNINEDDIEKYVGISKEYNVFELQQALSNKDLAKAITIIQYFEGNPKAAPIQMVLPALYNYFSKVLTVFQMTDKTEKALRPIFYNNPHAAR